MYGILTYIWLKFMANVRNNSIHGAYGMSMERCCENESLEGYFIAWFAVKIHQWWILASFQGKKNNWLGTKKSKEERSIWKLSSWEFLKIYIQCHVYPRKSAALLRGSSSPSLSLNNPVNQVGYFWAEMWHYIGRLYIIHSLKLTYPLKTGHPKRKLVLQSYIFRCYGCFTLKFPWSNLWVFLGDSSGPHLHPRRQEKIDCHSFFA